MRSNPTIRVDSDGEGLTISAEWEQYLSGRAKSVYRTLAALFNEELEGSTLYELAEAACVSRWDFLEGMRELRAKGLLSGLPED